MNKLAKIIVSGIFIMIGSFIITSMEQWKSDPSFIQFYFILKLLITVGVFWAVMAVWRNKFSKDNDKLDKTIK